MVKDMLDSLVTVLIMVFVFKGFVAEAFVIPTGSMADNLRGMHFRLTCAHCGHAFNYGFSARAYGYKSDETLPKRPISILPNSHPSRPSPRCPLCGEPTTTEDIRRVSNGDKILVLKYVYQLAEPNIWDVVVFKNPYDPSRLTYIKRLIGRPGETVEIIDGDVYIDGQIQPKPARVQETMWITVYDSDFQPPGNEHRQQDRIWGQPLANEGAESGWQINEKKRAFTFRDGLQNNSLVLDPRRLERVLRANAAYNGPMIHPSTLVSDLKLSLELTPHSVEGSVSLFLGKYGRVHEARIDFDGTCTITDQFSGSQLGQQRFEPLEAGQVVAVSFANVDHRLEIQLGDKRLIHEGANLPRDWGYNDHDVRLARDIHYTNATQRSNAHGNLKKERGRGTEQNPFTLEEDEFFVLGDNSPRSFDSRLWNEEGLGNGGRRWRAGVVPRDYLVGRALCVYWPGGYYFYPNFPYALIPNAGELRFIY